MYQRIDQMPKLPLSKQGEVAVASSLLVRKFGAPTDESWDRESLGSFYFAGPRNETFTVYRRAYDLDASTVKKLRKSFWLDDSAAVFSLGSMSSYDVAGFEAWLWGQLRA